MVALPIAAIVLSAGQSQRMGQPKALLLADGRSFLRSAINLASAADLQPIVVIAGAVPLQHHLSGLAVQCIDHPGWQAGEFSSLQAGVRWLVTTGNPGLGAVIFTVDRPRIKPTTIIELCRQITQAPDQVWQPNYQGQRAHPIFVPVAMFADIIAAPATATLRELLHRSDWAPRRASLPCDDPGVIENIDTPDALAQAGLTQPPVKPSGE